jgi:hypothetical protein
LNISFKCVGLNIFCTDINTFISIYIYKVGTLPTFL